MKKICFLVVVVLIIIVLLLARYENSSSALIGSWEVTDNLSIWNSYPEEMQLMSDGSANIDGLSGRYSVDGDTINLTAAWVAASYKFEVSGNKLTLDDGERTLHYERQE